MVAQLTFIEWLAERYGSKWEAEDRAFHEWMEANPPAHEYGYPPKQVDALVGDRREAFDRWIYGQTMALSDDGESIVYPHDLYSFLIGTPNLD